MFTATSQKDSFSLAQIWDGSFRTQGLNSLHSMNNGKQYSVLNFDRSTGSTSVDLYDYVTFSKVKVIATSKTMEAMVEKFRAKYPFGEWEYVRDKPEIAYTGRQISMYGDEIHIGQKDFCDGRMDELKVKRDKNRSDDSPCTPAEHAEFRSGVGNLHWATSQTRVDHAVDTSRLQKRQNAPTLGDLRDLAKTIKEVKDTSDVVVKIRPIQNMIVAAYTDSSLYGSSGELIDNDEDLKGFDKHKLHSQGGSLVVLMYRSHLDD